VCLEAIDVGGRAKVNGGGERDGGADGCDGRDKVCLASLESWIGSLSNNARASERGERGKGRAVIDKVAELDEF
jgi:hypothetical protein